MGDDITIGVTEIVNNIEVTAQPNDQVIDINVTDNSDEVTLNVTPNVIEVNINKGSSYARWGSIFGNLTDQADLTNALFNKADLVDGKVPSYQLPSFVDDVIEVANYAALPTVGEIGKIYITLDDNKIYRWSGSIYIEIASNQAIWGAITGTLSNQTDLQNALNLKADKSTTLTINGTTFDLSANRTFTIPTHDAVTLGTANGLSLSGQVLSLGLAGASSTGALSSTDWNTFNNKLSSLSGAVLTTTDQNVAGVKTFTNLSKFTNNTGSFAVEIDTTSSDALVVKNNGTTTLQISRSGEILGTKYRVSGGFSSQFLKANGDLDSTVYTPASRTITINGVTQDLTANRSFTVATHDAVTIGTANGLSLSGQALSLALASGSTTGALSAADWTTFNNKQNTITNPITGSGTINFLPKFTQSGSIGNSQIFDNGSSVMIGTSGTSSAKLSVSHDAENLGAIFTSNTNTSNYVDQISINYRGVGKMISCRGATTAEVFNVSNVGGGYFAGNVGIGTPSPAVNLHIKGSGSYSGIRVDNTGTTGGGYVALYQNGSQIGLFGVSGAVIGSTASDFAIFSETGKNIDFMTDGNTTPKMRINTSGNVGIGTTSPSTLFHIYKASFPILTIQSSSYQSSLGIDTTSGNLVLNNESNASLSFNTNATERMRITSGGALWLNTTSSIFTTAAQFELLYTGNLVFGMNMKTTFSDGVPINFVNSAGSRVGYIYQTNVATAYITSSDYRLKQDLKPINGLDLVSQIKVYDYEWKSDKTRAYGVLAHELQEVIPQAVNGEKDAEQMQGVDYSKLVPILVQAIQELKAEIELLKQK